MSAPPEPTTQRQLALGARDALRGIRQLRLVTTIALVFVLASEVTIQIHAINSTEERLEAHAVFSDDDGEAASTLHDASRRQKQAVLVGHLLLYGALFGVLAVSGQRELRLLKQLDAASRRLQVLEGLLPICSSCKKVRHRHGRHSDPAAWVAVESYVEGHSAAQFTHGLCPACAAEAFAEAGLPPPVEDPDAPGG